jgi:hypothetical protein
MGLFHAHQRSRVASLISAGLITAVHSSHPSSEHLCVCVRERERGVREMRERREEGVQG